MRQLFFLLLMGALCPTLAKCQCAIYACDETGAFGAGYNNDNQPTTMQECVDLAIKMCKEKGGTNCALLYKSYKTGWYAIINGKKSDGRNFFMGGDGYPSKADAEEGVRKKYKDGGGTNADYIKVYTWYAYNNPK